MSERFVFAVKWKRIIFISYTAKVGPSPALLVRVCRRGLRRRLELGDQVLPEGLGWGHPREEVWGLS